MSRGKNPQHRSGAHPRKILLVLLGLAVAIPMIVMIARRPRASTGDALASGAQPPSQNAVKLARLMKTLQALRKAPPQVVPTGLALVTVDDRLSEAAMGDPVGTAVPSLAALPKEKQIEMLKAMMSWPDHKFMSQVPQLAQARDLPLEERISLSEDLGHQLITHLEDEGYHFDLPPNFQPVGAPLPPLPPSEHPPNL
jgi:hypothetical protein